MKYFALIIALIIFLIDLYFAFISFGFQKKYCAKCKGYLAHTRQRKNVYIGRTNGRFYKHYIEYTYTYRVNGQEYKISDGAPGTKNNMRSAVDIIYQKKKPKFAYIHRLTIPFQPIIAFCLLPIWIMLIIAVVMY